MRRAVTVKRRSFLTCSAMAAVSLAVRSTVCAASEFPSPQTWTLFAAPNRFVVRLRGAALTVDCYDASDTQDCERGEMARTDASAADAAMLVAGQEEEAPGLHASAPWERQQDQRLLCRFRNGPAMPPRMMPRKPT